MFRGQRSGQRRGAWPSVPTALTDTPQRPRTQSKSFRPESTQFFSVALLDLAREVPAWVKGAQKLLVDKKYPEARAACEAGLKKDPRQMEGLLYLSEALWEQQQASGAIGALKEAIAANPRDSRPYALMGRYLLLKGLREQAVKFLEQAVTLNPEDAQSRKQLDRTRNIIRRGAKKVDAAPGALAGEAVARATRMIQLPAGGLPEQGADPTATAELPTVDPDAGLGVDAIPPELQKALAGLLTGNLFEVEGVSASAGHSRVGAFFRGVAGVLTLVVAVVLGLGAGLYVRKRVTEARGGTPLERAMSLLREDTPAATLEAAQVLERMGSGSPEFVAAQPLMAMAYAVLAVDLGGGTEALESAERTLNQLDEPDAPSRRTPAALMARQLLSTAPPTGGARERPPDDALAADLDVALKAHANDPLLHVVLARRAQDSHNDAAALDAWRRAYLLDTAFPLATLGLARMHARLDDRTEALRLLDGLLQLRPSHTGALLAAVLLAAADDKRLAAYEARARKVLEDKFTPPDEAARLAQALALVKTAARDESAAALWERAGTMTVQLPTGVTELARMHLVMGEPDKALELLRKVMEKNGSDLGALREVVRAEALAAMGPDALRELRTAFKGKSDWPYVRLPLGLIVADPGAPIPWHTHPDAARFPEATLAASMEGMTDMSPRMMVERLRAASVVAQAQTMLLNGRAREARKLLKESLGPFKNEPEVFIMAARTELVLGDSDAAEKLAREGLDMSPQDPRGRMVMARALLAQKDSTGAIKELDGILDNGFDSAAVHALRARALLDRGQDAEAAKELKAALLVDPTDPDATAVNALLAFNAGKVDDALAQLSGWARKDLDGMAAAARTDAAAGPLLALALHEVNRDVGLATMKDLASTRDKDPTVKFAEGLMRARRNEKADAVTALEAFLELADRDDRRRAAAQAALESLGAGGKKKGKRR